MAIKYLRLARSSAIQGTALVRLDFNTKDDWRMKAVLPTINFLLKKHCKVVIISHRGRPESVIIKNGAPTHFEKDLSLKRNAGGLSRMLRRKVIFINNFRFKEIKREIVGVPEGSVFLLENLRFMSGEEKNDPAFARSLASLADFYVNDAFAVSHRANASVTEIPKLLPSYAGLELENEIESLSKVMKKPKRPLVVILGGAKASDKLGVIAYFKKITDWFLLGGGPANTIMWLKGIDVKKSVRDTDPKDVKAMKDLSTYKSIVLPQDFVWSGSLILDFGPKTIKAFNEKIMKAGTILWSGPLGLIEKKKFTKGSIAIARAIGRNRKAFSVAGGGETVMFLKEYGLDKNFSFISTGGGAMVDFLAGRKLPGIEALK